MSESRTATDGEWTVRRVLDWTIGYLRDNGSESPRLDAEVLLAHAWDCPRIQLYTRFDVALPEDVRTRMRELVKRRAGAEPVAYLVGHREFYSLDFEVGPGVFIPRPSTETLVMSALDWLEERTAPRVLELCAGSGCISVTIAANHPKARVTAVELSSDAIAYTRRNVDRHKLTDRVDVIEGDLFSALGGHQPFDVIVSNPPYVTEGEMDDLPPDVRLHEPHLALTAGPTGLSVIKRIAESISGYLADEAIVLIELSPHHAEDAVSMFEQTGHFQTVDLVRDLDHAKRVLRAVRTG